MNIEVSVIVPVYNASKTIRKCVESIVFGKKKNVEILLIDDCSKDNSFEVCKHLEKEYEQVKCIRNKVNKGVSFTRNVGLSVAKGEFIAFVDSDDWVSQDYIDKLLTYYKLHKSFIISGYYYINSIEKVRNVTVYSNDEDYTIVSKGSFFELVNHILIQQLWNKIFVKDIIYKYNIRFDENISMGEDFDFVLDYMKAIDCEQCMIINQPLYYYVRANNSSLMSNFGKVNQDREYSRMNKLLSIIGKNDQTKKDYYKSIQNIKNNYIYHIIRDNNLNKKQKLEYIQNVDEKLNAIKYYKSQRKIYIKEKIFTISSDIKKIHKRIIGRLTRKNNEKLINSIKHKLADSNFTIISQNCIGGVFYHDMNVEFKSPTINLFIKHPEYIKFVNKLDYYLNLDICMEWDEEYPIGKLDDITIHFMHYETCKEAYNAWNRRKDRIIKNKLLILSTDRDGFNKEVFEEWKKIKYPKILFTANEEFGKHEDSIYYKEYKDNGHILDLIPKRKFYKDGVLIDKINSL